MDHFNTAHTGIGPYKAYIVTVIHVSPMDVPINILVLGCTNFKAALQTALHRCIDNVKVIGIKQTFEFDNLIDAHDDY
jgi:hypothetical protein